MRTPDEDKLRRKLQAEGETVTPDPEALKKIRKKVADKPGKSKRLVKKRHR